MTEFKELINHASRSNRIIPGFNIFAYEDAVAVLRAAEACNAPVMLLTNKKAINHIPIDYWGMLLNKMAKDAKVPVSIHLDHATDLKVIQQALSAGYHSIMYDGSQLPFDENLKQTRAMATYAHTHDLIIEGEIGSVGYSDRPETEYTNQFTNPIEAETFSAMTQVDMMAVSVGTVHKMDMPEAKIQYDLIRAIEAKTDIPLVIHGFSGVSDTDVQQLRKHHIGKVNIGTVIRQAFGYTLKEGYAKHPEVYDRMTFMEEAMEVATKKAIEKINQLWN